MTSAVFKSLLVSLAVLLSGTSALSQEDSGGRGSQEISEKENIPVLIKHLPEWETKQRTAVFTTKAEDLRTYLGERRVFDAIDFIPGTEAVIASYPAGKLLIVEFTTPQASADADEQVRAFAETAEVGDGFFYRRIGNYNVFLFDGTDKTEADALFDQIKYEKVVQWLGRDPTILARAEREFIVGTMNLFIATVLVILTGLGTSVVIGIIAGLLFFAFRDHRRSSLSAFSDFGGLTRLNLDDLTTELGPERLLNE